jgi:ATP-dependent Zn protease
MFTDTQDESNYALNMRGVDTDHQPSQARTFVVDRHGHMQMNGMLPTSQRTLAMAVAAPQNTHGIAMNALIDAEVQCILNEGRGMARSILTEHADQLVLLADVLMKDEQLDRAQFEALLAS